MLPKKYRVSAGVFQQRGRVIYKGEPFIVKSVANNLSHNRFGVVVGRRVFKKAVQRNAFKRIVQKFLAAYREQFNLPNKQDFIIIFSPVAARISPEELQNQLKKFFTIS